ncbi:sugar phosphate isomerase/epimerase family protein [Jatrophihabitans fulvus]
MPPQDEPLILASGSLAALPFRDRVAAAAGAGFDALGLSIFEYDRLRAEGTSDAEMLTVLDDHGLQILELEVLLGFDASDEARQAEPIPGVAYPDAVTESRMLDLAGTFGIRHMQTVGTFGTETFQAYAVERFAALCDRAAAFDLLVALEFVPGTSVPDAGTATRIVTEAGRPNGGICADIWHHTRGRNDDTLLAAIPSDRVVMIQLDDGPAEPVLDDFVMDTLLHRLPPGHGDFDVVGFLDLLWSDGASAPISVEVLSGDLAARPAHEVAALLAATTRDVLAAAASRLVTPGR